MSFIPQPSVLTSGFVTSASSGVTASITPTTGRLIIVAVFNRLTSAGSANAPTLSGLSITWHQIATKQSSFFSGQFRVTLFAGILTSAITGAITIDCASQSQNSLDWAVVQFANNVKLDFTNPQNAIVQTANAESNSANSSLTATLSTFANPNNATIGVFGKDGQNQITPGSNFTSIVNLQNDAHMLLEFAGNNQTAVNASWTSDTTAKVALAAEIKCQFSGGGGIFLL